MERKRKWYRRPATFAALAVMLVALAVPVSFALAGSAVTVPLLHNTLNCGLGSDNSAIGAVSFSRDKDGNLTVKADIRGAEPSTTYYMWLFFDGPDCSYNMFWGTVGHTKIGSGGAATIARTFPGTKGFNDFWVLAHDNNSGRYDETAVVHLSN
jgi:hypothetical protein